MHFISGILLQTRNLLLEQKYLSCDFFPHSPAVFITDTVISVHTREKTICFESSDLSDLYVGLPEAAWSRKITCV